MNVSFINPYFLAGLPAIFIPLVIHLLSQKKSKTIIFSYLKFIKIASEKSVKRFRVKQYILLLIRTLLVLIITFIFARPVFRFSALASKKDYSISTVFIIDNSYSMKYVQDGNEIFDIAKESAKRILRVLKEQDKSALLTVSDMIKPLVKNLTSDKNLINEIIDKTAVSLRTTDISKAIYEGFKILKESPSQNKQVILITDAGENGWKSINIEITENFDPTVKLLVVDVANEKRKNAFIYSAEVLKNIGEELKNIKVEVKNYTDLKEIPISLYVGNRKTNEGFIKLSKELSYNQTDADLEIVKLQIKNDNLKDDDFYFIKTRAERRVKILLVDGNIGLVPVKSQTYYINLAINPDIKSGRFVTEIVIPEQLKTIKYEDYSVIFFCNVSEVGEEEITKLTNYYQKGGNIVFFMGDKINPDFYNYRLKNIIPASILKLKEDGKITYWEREHPSLKVFTDDKEWDITTAKFYRYYSVLPNEESKALIMFGDNSAYLVESTILHEKQGKVLLFTSSPNRDWTNIPTKPFFLPLIQNLAEYLTENKEKKINENLIVGEKYIKELKRWELPEYFDLVCPDSKIEKIKPSIEKDFSGIKFENTEQCGIYTLINKGKKDYFAVNLALQSGESELKKISYRNIKKLFPKTSIFVITDIKNLEKEILQVMHGKEITKNLIFIAIGLLIIETFIANRKKFIILYGIFSVLFNLAYCQQSNKFVFTQLKYDGDWDPHPYAANEIISYLATTTSVKSLPERRIMSISDKLLFSSPFLCILGSSDFPLLKDTERERIKRYILGGGIILIDNISGRKGLGFDRAIRTEFLKIFPGINFEKIPIDHAVYRSFYLLKNTGGRRLISPYLEGINIDNRVAVIYSHNDLLGTWERDKLGNWLYQCIPGGETQRWDGIKLTINIIMYCLTGTYKSDVIHEPFIKQKLR